MAEENEASQMSADKERKNAHSLPQGSWESTSLREGQVQISGRIWTVRIISDKLVVFRKIPGLIQEPLVLFQKNYLQLLKIHVNKTQRVKFVFVKIPE